jgi:DNA invertase Pin-like site-specific DNA recombinase
LGRAYPIEGRPGFRALLDRIVGNGVRTVVVEDASRFASNLDGAGGGGCHAGQPRRPRADLARRRPDRHDEMRVAMRQIVGVFSQLEKTRLAKKLRAARDRKRKGGRKVEGRKSFAELKPEVVSLAKRLRCGSPKTGGRASCRTIARELEAAGFPTNGARGTILARSSAWWSSEDAPKTGAH